MAKRKPKKKPPESGTIFQAFLLIMQDTPQGPKVDLPKEHMTWPEIRKVLKDAGFTVLCSQTRIGGFPPCVLVGCEVKAVMLPDIKGLFYRVAEGLPFKSGDWFMKE